MADNSSIQIRLFSNRYSCFVLIFLLSCTIKLFYLAHHNYYIPLSDQIPIAYSAAKQYSIAEILKTFFLDFNCQLFEIARPFFTTFLYVIGFKLGGFSSLTVFLLGILVGSLAVPLYYLSIAGLFNFEIALCSSLVLAVLTNYIQQSLALTTVIPGIVFLFLSPIYSRHLASNIYSSNPIFLVNADNV